MKPDKGASWELLALIRFLLAAIVMVSHSGTTVLANPLFRWIADFGAFTAVLAFLILSGYSIGHSYDRKADGFYRRRLLRIYPMYALAISYSVGIDIWMHTCWLCREMLWSGVWRLRRRAIS
jgi:peptidoglycan/LPS O-acetylase OafA/YrhL